MTVIDIGDGRFVEYTEGALLAPMPPPPKPKKPYVPPRKKDGRDKSVVIRGMKFKCDPRPAGQVRGNPNLTRSTVPGFTEWNGRRAGQLMALTAIGRQFGTPQGMTKKQADAMWVIAKRKAKKDMENIKKSGIVLSEAAEEALTETLEIMRSKLDQKTRLTAAKLILDFTMAKPAAKQDVTISSAEKWLADLGDQ